MTMADFRAFLREENEHTHLKLDNLKRSTSTLSSMVSDVEHLVNVNTEQIERQGVLIAGNQASISQMKEEIFMIKRGEFPPLPTPLQSGAGRTSPALTSAQTIAFLVERRSLHLCPILGATTLDMWNSIRLFLGQRLALGKQIEERVLEAVTRVQIQGSWAALRKIEELRFGENRGK